MTQRSLVRHAMSVSFRRLSPDTSLAEAAHELWRSGWVPVPVVDGGGRLVGALSSQDVVRAVALRLDTDSATVHEFAATDQPVVSSDASLDDVAAEMRRNSKTLAMVVDDSRLAGILTVSDVRGYRLAETELGPLAVNVIKEISPNDQMYSNSWGAYTIAGVTALQCIRDALRKLGQPDPRSILDLPCGHGRELRFLKVAYPDAEFGACDIDEDGVGFCADMLGAHPIVSHEDPDRVSIDRAYQLAWSGSLFTHLSAERWPGFLNLFARAIEPGGLVLFTTNEYLSPSVLRHLGLSRDQAERMLADVERENFGYVDVSPRWGLSLARPDWVRDQIERSPLELVSYERAAWKPPMPPHDVLVCRLPAR